MITLIFIFIITLLSVSSSSFQIDAAQAGVDIVDIAWNFWNTGSGGPVAATKAMQDACSTAELRLVRFAATPFWPKQLQQIFLASAEAEAQYWNSFEQLLATAARFNCQIVPSLFWNWFLVPDSFQEHLGDSMRNASSQSRAFWQRYATKLVSVVNNFSASSFSSSSSNVVVAWELGNELSLLADLNMSGSTDLCDVVMGTPTSRTIQDNISTSDMVAFETWLANVIRSADSAYNRPISTGHSFPRRDAYHLQQSYHAAQRDWTLDTKEQFQQNLIETTACCEWISMHYYPGSGGRWGHGINSTYPLLLAAQTIKSQMTSDKVMYVGEFGNENPGPRVFSHDVLNQLGEIQSSFVLPSNRIKTTIWVWEFYQFSPTSPAKFSLIPGRDDEMINALQQFNEKYN